jgi:hypothetical protein
MQTAVNEAVSGHPPAGSRRAVTEGRIPAAGPCRTELLAGASTPAFFGS